MWHAKHGPLRLPFRLLEIQIGRDMEIEVRKEILKILVKGEEFMRW